MSLSFKFVPLTFLKDQTEIRRQVRNTVILSHFFERNDKTVPLQKFIEGTQYGYNASALQSGKNKFLRISDITDGKVDWETVPYCDCVDEKTYLLFPDDILIARTGGTTGKSFKIYDAPDGAIYAGYLIRIRANENCLPDFLNVFLNSYSYWSQIVSLNEGEFRPSVNANKLRDLLLPNCSRDEQIDIVRFSNGENVDGYEGLIFRIEESLKGFNSSLEISYLLESQKERVSQLKQSILQEAIQGKLTEEWRSNRQAQGIKVEPASELLKRIKSEKAKLIKEKKIKKEKPLPPITEAEKPFELPEGWEWSRLGEITNYGSSEKAEPYQLKDDTWVLDLEDIEKESSRIIQRKTFKERSSASSKSVFKKGWVLYSKLRPYLDKVVIADDNGVCTTEILPLPVYSNLNSKFMMFGMKSREFLIYVNSKVGGMKMPRLGTEDGSMAVIPIAPVEEQKAIVDKVESLMDKCRELEEEIKQSEQNAQMLMQAVLKEAFEGKEVQDA